MTETGRQNPQNAPLNLMDFDADYALFRGHLDGMIAFFPENERPLQGLVGLLDWRFQGAISEKIKAGAIIGKPGEVVYLPITRAGRAYHLFLAGAGYSSAPGARGQLPMETFQALRKNLASLKPEKIGISRSDAGNISDELLEQHLKGVPLWIVP